MKKTKKKLVTHNGSFHADDIFACATLILYLEKNTKEFSAKGGPASCLEISRTRDEEVIKSGDYVFDVGGVYDPDKNRFDHHQPGGAGKHDNPRGKPWVEYASFGLVWKKFGIELCGNMKVVNLVNKVLVSPIDAGDNGIELIENKYDISPYFLHQAFDSMRPTWREEKLTNDEMFLKCVA